MIVVRELLGTTTSFHGTAMKSEAPGPVRHLEGLIVNMREQPWEKKAGPSWATVDK
jgi:hypothetical protein